MAKYQKREMQAYVKVRGNIVGSRFALAVVVGIVFVILKLVGALSWSWTWVTVPFWGGAAYLVLAFVGLVALAVTYD